MVANKKHAGRARAVWPSLITVVTLLVTGSIASAETLLMPERDFRRSVSEVVWGVTTQANGTAFTINFGDGTAPVAGNVVDRSYIAFNHTYANVASSPSR